MARVTEGMRFNSTNNRIHSVRGAMDKVNEAAISGYKLKQLSDDPSGSVRVFRNRTQLKNIDQYKKNSDFARGYLGRSEDSLISMNNILIRARELGIQQSNATWSQADREAVSEELRQLVLESVNLANATYADRFVFGGFRTSTPPVTPEGNYIGDDGLIYIQMDESNFHPVNVSGRDLFEDPENPELTPIHALQKLYKAMKENNVEELRNSLPNLEAASSKVTNNLAKIGARLGAVNALEERLDKNQVNYMKDNSNLQDTDLIEASLQLKALEGTVNYTMQASAKTLTPSLMEFLR